GIDLGAPRAVLCVGLPAAEPGVTPPPPLTRQAATVLRRAAMVRRLEPVLDLRGRDMVLLVRASETRAAALRTTVGLLLREAGTRYLVTLAAYLRDDRHLKPAAAALGIHINTLRYRLARIEKLLGVRLDDVDARFLLELAVRLVEARDGEALSPTRARRLSG